MSNGISDRDADLKIKEFSAERNSEIRRIGIKKTVIGAVVTVGAGIFLYLGLKHADIGKMSSIGARGFATAAIVIAVGGLYGISKLIDGITYVVRPHSIEKAISEI